MTAPTVAWAAKILIVLQHLSKKKKKKAEIVLKQAIKYLLFYIQNNIFTIVFAVLLQANHI